VAGLFPLIYFVLKYFYSLDGFSLNMIQDSLEVMGMM